MTSITPVWLGVAWATLFIWGGVVLLIDNLQLITADWWNAWPIFFIGAGVIMILGALARVMTSRFRFAGGFVFGLILIGIGLSWLVNWTVVWPILLIIIGLAILWRGIRRRR